MQKINFARLNHLLIPATKQGRDRLRHSRAAWLYYPFAYLYETFTVEGWSFAMASIGAGVLGLDVTVTDTHWVWGALTGLLLASLLLSRLCRLDGVRLLVSAPRRVTIGDELTFILSASNEGPKTRRALRFGGPFLPWDGSYTSRHPALAVLPPGETGQVEVKARFSDRGEHHLDSFRVAALVPLGLAQGPAIESADCRFLVVPRIASVVRVSTPVGRRHQPGGVALASKTGESMDLRGVRPYRPGDPVRDLHARSWARTGSPVVREYQQEYFSRIGVVLDTDTTPSSSRNRTTGPTATGPEGLEAALSLAAGVIACLSRGEALIDLLVVGDRVHTLTLGRNLGTFEQALDLLACVQPGPRFDAEKILQRLTPHLPRLSCVVLVALDWDSARARLADRIRSFGVGCRSLLVTGGGPITMIGATAGTTAGPTIAATGGQGEHDRPHPVSMTAIASGEALSL